MICIYEYDGLDVKFNISMGNMTLTQNNNYQIFTNNIRLKVGNNQYVINKLYEIYLTMSNNTKISNTKKPSKLIIYDNKCMVFYNAIIEEMTIDFNSHSSYNDIDMNIIYDWAESIDYDLLMRKEKIEKLLNRMSKLEEI
jgi:hypothetical protein